MSKVKMSETSTMVVICHIARQSLTHLKLIIKIYYFFFKRFLVKTKNIINKIVKNCAPKVIFFK